ncbi:globin domain-containing protein [Spirosoma flavum]|uniref:Globin domain-containing protein n=1 Tax=Spirosoma flavum TaxID=2048557 RepID=A0ABW6ANH0_9BACT
MEKSWSPTYLFGDLSGDKAYYVFMVTQQQLQLVKQTWKLLREIDPAVLGDVFYSRLFIQYPTLRPMFKGSMEIQYQKFVDMLSIIVARLDRPDTVAQEIGMLARSHAGYGVQPSHYEDVKEALLWTLERGLGLDWNVAVQQAWIACYDAITQLMLEQAH